MFRIIGVVAFVICSESAIAQAPMSTPFFFRRPWTTTPVEASSKKHEFTVIFKDSTKLTSRAKIDEHKGRFYLAINEPTLTRSIIPSQTLAISRPGKDGKIYTGIATDSCWLFKIVEGKINLYSVLSEDNFSFIIAMQKGNDAPIVPLNKENAKEAVIDDPTISAQISDQRKIYPIIDYNKKYKAKEK